jgi:hypothetical protein
MKLFLVALVEVVLLVKLELLEHLDKVMLVEADLQAEIMAVVVAVEQVL